MGCLRDCHEIYSAIRKTFFNATLTRFGIGKLSASDVQRMLLKLPGADALVKQAKQILSAMEEAPRETFLRFVRAVEGDMSCVDNVRENGVGVRQVRVDRGEEYRRHPLDWRHFQQQNAACSSLR
nr:exocyst complex component EXO70B1-like [Ipomoea batatas]